MRTVDRDDFLVVRGANPRTGLITPEANSIAGSSDGRRAHAGKKKGPSAQWKLEGDSWVSFIQDVHGQTSNIQSTPNKDVNHAVEPDVRTLRVARRRQRNVSPLTEANLQSFEQILPELQKSPMQPSELKVDRRTSNTSKVRRKPVPSSIPPDTTLGSRDGDRRQPSENTIIHTPFAESPEHESSYFSPEDVKHATARQTHRPLYDPRVRDMSFLEAPVKARQRKRPQPRAFTGTKTSLEQLQQSLRTNSGPFPSLHSRTPPGMQARHIEAFSGMHQQGPRLMPTGVPLYHRSCPRTGPMPQPRGTRGISTNVVQQTTGDQTRQTRPFRPTLDRSIGFESTNADLPQTSDGDMLHSTSQSSHITCVRGGNDQSTCREREVMKTPKIIDVEGSSAKHMWTIAKAKSSREKECSRLRSLDIPQAQRDQNYKLGPPDRFKRPIIGSRAAETLNIPKFSLARTITALEDPSNSIGIEQSAIGDDVGDDDITDRASKNSSEAETNDSASVSRSADARSLDSTTSFGEENADLHDHSLCCPECCVTFDCHEGCLGHPSPCASVAENETSSLRSMGVLDATFETSVKAINETLLEPDTKRDGKLAKVRAAIVNNFWQSPAVNKTSKEERSKPSLRSAARQVDKPERLLVSGSRASKAKQAKAAAAVAMGFDRDGGTGAKASPDISKKSRERTAKSTESHRLRQTVPIADVGHCQIQHDEGQEWDDPSGPQLVAQASPKGSKPPSRASNSDASSVITKITSLVRHNSTCSTDNKISSRFVAYLLVVVTHFKDVLIVLLDTITFLTTILYQYKCTGKIVVPEGTKLSLVAGNCLRSLLYIMIAACIWALMARVSRMVLLVIRITILPLKVVTWVIG